MADLIKVERIIILAPLLMIIFAFIWWFILLYRKPLFREEVSGFLSIVSFFIFISTFIGVIVIILDWELKFFSLEYVAKTIRVMILGGYLITLSAVYIIFLMAIKNINNFDIFVATFNNSKFGKTLIRFLGLGLTILITSLAAMTVFYLTIRFSLIFLITFLFLIIVFKEILKRFILIRR